MSEPGGNIIGRTAYLTGRKWIEVDERMKGLKTSFGDFLLRLVESWQRASIPCGRGPDRELVSKLRRQATSLRVEDPQRARRLWDAADVLEGLDPAYEDFLGKILNAQPGDVLHLDVPPPVEWEE